MADKVSGFQSTDACVNDILPYLRQLHCGITESVTYWWQSLEMLLLVWFALHIQNQMNSRISEVHENKDVWEKGVEVHR